MEIDKYLFDHFGIGDDDGGDIFDENRIYKPNELLFAIDKLSDLDNKEGLGLDLRSVVLVPIDFWEAEHCMADFIGGHNVDKVGLVNGGICDTELSEGIFEFWGKEPDMLKAMANHDWDLVKHYSKSYTDEYMIEMISSAGFVYSQELYDFLNQNR